MPLSRDTLITFIIPLSVVSMDERKNLYKSKTVQDFLPAAFNV